MTVRFILGPSGAGKTRHCLDALAQRVDQDPLGPPLLFILPQQATFIHEQMLAASCRGQGFSRATVSGLARLAQQACRAAGDTLPPAVSESGKLLLTTAATRRCGERLRVFAGSARRAGFAAQLVAAAEELQIYGVSPERLSEVAAQLTAEGEEPHFAARLEEIALLYTEYSELAGELSGGYAQQMDYLAQRIRAGFLHDTEVWLDGYSEFTPAEIQVLRALMADCPRLEICLNLDPDQAEQPLSQENVFYPTWHSYSLLREAARQEGAEVLPPLLLRRGGGRFAANPELAALEQALAGQRVRPRPGAPAHLHQLQAADRREELLVVGREIRRLVRREGLRYRQISLIARDSAPYAELLPEIFGDLEIPYFIDSKKPLLYHPLIELVRAALEVWAYRPRYRHIMRLLKNGLSPISGEPVDLLDNYVLAHGVRFYHWQSRAWDFPLLEGEDEQYLAEINAIRDQGAGPVMALLSRLGEEATAAELNRALLSLLSAWEVRSALRERQQQALAEGRGEEASCHGQAWDKLTAFFSEADLLLGDQPYPAAELAELYDAAFSGLTFSTIPPGLDQVLVASLERSRNPELSACFVLGMNEGLLPRRIAMEGLFCDQERRLLAARGLELAPDTVARQLRENYLSYVALTRSGGELFLSRTREDGEGRPLAPSPLWRQVRSVFPDLPPAAALDPERLVGGSVDLELAAEALRQEEPDPLWQAVYAHYQQQQDFAAQVAQVRQGLHFRPELNALSPASRRRLYGRTLRGSVSRLERFRRCPFSYFAAYGLRLRPRREYKLSPADRGDLFHYVLADVGHYLQRENIDWTRVDGELARMLVDRSLAGYLPRFLSGIMQSSSRYAYLSGRIRDALAAAVLATAEHMRRGDFRPVAYELPFGLGEEGLPAFALELDDGRWLELSGRIDRVDLAQSADGERTWLRVIDYKTGDVSLNPEDIAAGLQMQLMVYLQVVLTNSVVFSPRPAAAAGLYYAPVRDELESLDAPRESESPGLKLSGLTIAAAEAVRLADRDLDGVSRLIPVHLTGDDSFRDRPAALSPEQLADLGQQLAASLRQSAAAMLDGLIRVSPLAEGKHSACAYCDYRSVCSFDREQARPRGKNDPFPAEVGDDEQL